MASTSNRVSVPFEEDVVDQELEVPIVQKPAVTEASLPYDAAWNATLGFAKIFALSSGPSWRTRGLQAAAELTGLDITIPPQPAISPDLVAAFRSIGEFDPTVRNTPTSGAAQAWLAHLDLLKHVVLSEYETALIVEDDVDWDIDIKTQMMLLSNVTYDPTDDPWHNSTPYGTDWDLLWLGLCGELSDSNSTAPYVGYLDHTVLPHANYTGWSRQNLAGRRPEGHRFVQRGIHPKCTFAYAVTKRGAQNVLRWAGSGKSLAFDVRLSEAAWTRALDVLIVQPELMYQYTPDRSAANVSDKNGVALNENAFENLMGGTENVKNSARCKALFNSTCVKPFRGKNQESEP